MRLIVPLLAVLLVPIGASTQRSEPFVPVGVWFGGPPNGHAIPGERREWRRDLQTIRSAGFNSITVPVEWAGSEPVRGTYRFDALDDVLTVADRAALKVVVQLVTVASPAWLLSRYPDARVVTAGGERAPSGHCLDHPGVRADVAAFIGAVSVRAAGHPSFHAIDVWSAPAGRTPQTGTTPEFCHCQYTVRRFREWLERKYGTLAALNRAWRRGFGSWNDVEPPRSPARSSRADAIDWTTFAAARLREDVKMKADASAARGARPVISHTGAPSVLYGPLSGASADDWWMSTAVDQYGLSVYPRQTSGPTASSPLALAFSFDGIRSAARDRGWWLRELQAGQQRLDGDGGAITAADLRVWSWAALARGARGISYYAWYGSGRDGAGGMMESDGAITHAAGSAGQFADLVTRNAALFAPLRPRASRVAILYNPRSYFAAVRTESTGTPVRDSMLGFYRAMFERNIQTDFIHPDEVASGIGSNYAAIFLGYAPMLSQTVIAALDLYVRNGGTLISEALPASRREEDDAAGRTSGGGLDHVFGARGKAVRRVDSAAMLVERDLEGPLVSLAGTSITGTRVAEHLEVTGPAARVLARFPGERGTPGDPAIVMSTYGSGRAIRIGTFPAAAFEQDPAGRQSAGELLHRLIAMAGIGPFVRLDGGAGSVEARILESADALLLIAINHAETPQTVTMRFPPDVPEAIWQNMETGAVVNFVAGPEGPTYRRSFAARDVVVLMIRKRWR